MGLVLRMVISGTNGSKMARMCWVSSFSFADLIRIGHLIYTSKTPGFCFNDGRVACVLRVFVIRVLSVVL
jgi:hypothetical protein